MKHMAKFFHPWTEMNIYPMTKMDLSIGIHKSSSRFILFLHSAFGKGHFLAKIEWENTLLIPSNTTREDFRRNFLLKTTYRPVHSWRILNSGVGEKLLLCFGVVIYRV